MIPVLSVGELKEVLNKFDDGDAIVLSCNNDSDKLSIPLQVHGDELTITVWLSQKRYDTMMIKRAEGQ